jgi:hypothetical protein
MLLPYFWTATVCKTLRAKYGTSSIENNLLFSAQKNASTFSYHSLFTDEKEVFA